MKTTKDRQKNTAVVLIPTYNEVDNIDRLIPAVLAAAPVDLIILDDSSPDGTAERAQDLADRDCRVQVVVRQAKRGLGRAYIDGFERALAGGYDRIIQMDADFSHDPKELPKLLAATDICDLALGSRWVAGGGTVNWPLPRILVSRCGSLYARQLLGVQIRDLTGGFKCWRSDCLRAIDLRSVNSTGYAFQVEMTYRAFSQGFRISELPITFVERQSGVSKMSSSIIREAVLRVPLLRLNNLLSRFVTPRGMSDKRERPKS